MTQRTPAMAPVVSADEAGIQQAVRTLARGGLLGLPTETVYGLGADALNAKAVARVFAAKERPRFDPLIVHVAEPSWLGDHALVDLSGFSELGLERLRRLMECWPGPLTLVLPRGPAVIDLITAGLGTVAVRIPAHHVALQILASLGRPVVAPSANLFGRTSPTEAHHVARDLAGRIDLVVDGGRCAVGVESTIVGVQPDGTMRLLRPGGWAQADLEAVAAGPIQQTDNHQIEAPGQSASHYAPSTPVVMLALALPGPMPDVPEPWALLLMSGDPDRAARALRDRGHQVALAVSLSAEGDPAEIAHNLFAGLRRCDASGAATILAEPPPTRTGLGHAVADRLSRAAAKRDSTHP
jgi:L-threonylcarbamoyladenylate synthase